MRESDRPGIPKMHDIRRLAISSRVTRSENMQLKASAASPIRPDFTQDMKSAMTHQEAMIGSQEAETQRLQRDSERK